MSWLSPTTVRTARRRSPQPPARLVERFDSVKKSKGFAIEYLIGHLTETGEFDSIDALVIIDADTTIDADLLRYFDKDLRAGHDWIQCYYTVANPDDTMRTRLLTYAFSLYNGVMLLGQCVLGSAPASRATECACPLVGCAGFPGNVTGWLRIWSIPGRCASRGSGSCSSPGLRFMA